MSIGRRNVRVPHHIAPSACVRLLAVSALQYGSSSGTVHLADSTPGEAAQATPRRVRLREHLIKKTCPYRTSPARRKCLTGAQRLVQELSHRADHAQQKLPVSSMCALLLCGNCMELHKSFPTCPRVPLHLPSALQSIATPTKKLVISQI